MSWVRAMTDHHQADTVRPPQALRLRIPEPMARPGESPAFRDLHIDRAGEVRRPPVDVAPQAIVDLGADMIRVLNVDGDAVGPWAGTLDADQLRRGLRDMLIVRSFDAQMLQRPPSGQHVVLHAVPGGGGACRAPTVAPWMPGTCASPPTGSRGC